MVLPVLPDFKLKFQESEGEFSLYDKELSRDGGKDF